MEVPQRSKLLRAWSRYSANSSAGRFRVRHSATKTAGRLKVKVTPSRSSPVERMDWIRDRHQTESGAAAQATPRAVKPMSQ